MNVHFMVHLELRTAQLRSERAAITIPLPDDTAASIGTASIHLGRIALPNTGGMR